MKDLKKKIIPPVSKHISWKKFYGHKLTGEETVFEKRGFYDELILKKPVSLELPFGSSGYLPKEIFQHIITYLPKGDIKNLVVATHKIEKAESLLPPQAEHFLGAILTKPIAKCTLDYARNVYHKNNSHEFYLKCIQKAYSIEWFLESISGEFAATISSILVSFVWPGCSQDSYKFLEAITQQVSSPFMKGLISTVVIESMPLIGEVVIDGVQYAVGSVTAYITAPNIQAESGNITLSGEQNFSTSIQ